MQASHHQQAQSQDGLLEGAMMKVVKIVNEDRMRIVTAVETCPACPSQWDAWTNEGEYLYLRYRWGYGTVNRGDVDGPLFSDFEHGGKFDGDITLEKFCQLAGLELDL